MLGASRYGRLRLGLRMVVSVLLGLGLLIVFAVLLAISGFSQVDPTTPWVATASTFFVACSIQALVLGYLAGWGAVRWIFGTIAVTGMAFIAGALSIVVFGSKEGLDPYTQAEFLNSLRPGLTALIVITGAAGVILVVLWRTGWARDTGAFPWDLDKARTTNLGRRYMGTGRPVVAAKAAPPPDATRPSIAMLRNALIDMARLRLAGKADPVVKILLASPLTGIGLEEAINRVGAAEVDGVSPNQLTDIAAELRGLKAAWLPPI